MQQNIRISLIVGLAIAIGAMLVPVSGVPAVFASGHHHHGHHHHHHGHHHPHHHQHDHHSSVRVHQSVDQANLCDHSGCSNVEVTVRQ